MAFLCKIFGKSNNKKYVKVADNWATSKMVLLMPGGCHDAVAPCDSKR